MKFKKFIKRCGKIKKAKTDFVYNEELIKDVNISERPISLTEIIRNVKKSIWRYQIKLSNCG